MLTADAWRLSVDTAGPYAVGVDESVAKIKYLVAEVLRKTP